MNASAVLIYPDPSDYSIGEETDLYGHVSESEAHLMLFLCLNQFNIM